MDLLRQNLGVPSTRKQKSRCDLTKILQIWDENERNLVRYVRSRSGPRPRNKVEKGFVHIR